MNIELNIAILIAFSLAAIPVARWVFHVPAAASRRMPVIWDDIA